MKHSKRGLKKKRKSYIHRYLPDIVKSLPKPFSYGDNGETTYKCPKCKIEITEED